MATSAPGTTRVFVSYNRQDIAFTRRLVETLERLEVYVWVDWEGAREGDFIKRINQGLERCEWLVLVETPNSLGSKAVEMEVNAAQNRVLYGQMRGVIRLVAAARDPRTVPPTWATLQFYDATSDFDGTLAAMLAAIRATDARLPRRPGGEHPGAQSVSPSAPPLDTLTPAGNLIARMARASEAGDWDRTDDIAEQLLRRYPKELTIEFYRLWGRAQLELGKPAEAAKTLQEALKRDQDDIPTTRAVARALLRAGDQRGAAPLLRSALITDDDDERLDVLREYVPTLEGLGELDEALRRVEQALRLARDDPSWLIAKRDLLVKLNRQPEALEPARQLAARPDATADDALALARLARATGALDEAVAALVEAGQRAPGTPALAAERAALLPELVRTRERALAAGQLPEALRLLDTELALASGDSGRLIARADLLRRLGRTAEAGQTVTALVASGSNPIRDSAQALALARLCAELGLASAGWAALEAGGLLAPAALGGASGAETLAVAQALVGRPGVSAIPGQRAALARTLAAGGQLKEAWPLLSGGDASDPLLASTRAELFPPPAVPQRLASLGFRGANIGNGQAIVPPLVTIPAGPFQMGEGNEQHWVEVAAFQIGKYPVTVAEYALAVAAKAVREPPASGSVNWAGQQQHPDHPVVCVSWRDAVAYTAWLVEATGWRDWRLPTEAEWEKAARWDPQRKSSRVYPWGDSFDKDRCNSSESGIGTTSPVGSYPASDARRGGASPFGVEEMAGNVWEWTSSLYKPYPYTQNDGREDQNNTGSRILRGGSWYGDRRVVRAAYRYGFGPGDASYILGFRLVRAAPGS